MLQRLEETCGVELLDEYLGGAFAQQMLWHGDDGQLHRNPDRAEPFRVLPLEVKGNETVEEALRQMVEGEPIDGYVVEETGQRVDALKRSTVGRLPHTLILQLKRFEFDFDAMAKLKLNSRCAFPPTLDLEPFTAAGLARRETDPSSPSSPTSPVSPSFAAKDAGASEAALYRLVGERPQILWLHERLHQREHVGVERPEARGRHLLRARRHRLLCRGEA